MSQRTYTTPPTARIVIYEGEANRIGNFVLDLGDPTFVRLVFPERFPGEDVTPYKPTHDGWRPLVGLPVLRDDPSAFIRAAREIHEVQRDDLVRDTSGDVLGPCDQDAPAGALPRKTEDTDGLDP
ncbi:MAG: hypothetical protein AMXMBFR64_12580 [Myxococcales bacterium]